MKLYFYIGIFLMLLTTSSNLWAARTIKLCVDNSRLYPFSFIDNRKLSGLHIDIVKAALSNLGYRYKITPVRWGGCLVGAKYGQFDAILSTSYQKKLTRVLIFPIDASTTAKSPWRISQVSYVLITLAKDNYRYLGNPKTIPQPIYVPNEYNVPKLIKKAKLKIDHYSKTTQATLNLLQKNQKGSVIATSELAEQLIRSTENRNLFTIQPVALNSKSYFFAFAKRSLLTNKQRKRIWQAIANVRTKDLTKFSEQYL